VEEVNPHSGSLADCAVNKNSCTPSFYLATLS